MCASPELHKIFSVAPAVFLTCLAGAVYAGPINTTTVCGNASYCLFDSNNYSTPLAAEQAFVGAVGLNPLGQQNFGSYSPGNYTATAVGPLFSLQGLNTFPLTVVTGGPVGGGKDVGTFEGFALGLGGLYYYGYSYAETGSKTSAVGVASGVPGLSGISAASSGFFGVISSTPLSKSGGAISLAGGGSGPTYVDDVLYAGAPGISASNPLYPDQQTGGGGGGGGGSCSGLFCDIFVDIGAVAACVSGVCSAGAWLDPAGASSYTYETLDGSLFTAIDGFPTGFSQPFDVSSAGIDYGLFEPGQTLQFPGAGVSSFTVSGINPLVDGSNPTAFPLDVALNQTGATVEAIAGQASSAPEPSSILLFTSGIALMAVYWLRRMLPRLQKEQ